MLELEDAVARVLAAVPPPQPERIPLLEAYGRIVLDPLLSEVDLPPFDNSAVDGYAARAEDIPGAKASRPVPLRLAGSVAAGQSYAGQLDPGCCIRIFTGSPLPRGADCVVMQEDTHSTGAGSTEVLILAAGKPWENVRLRGEDLRHGARLCAAGEPIRAGTLSLLAAAGISELTAGRRPIVGVIATGSELRESGQALGPGEIYESNRGGLAALIGSAGGRAEIFPIVADSLDATVQAISQALSRCDLLLTVGGASVGDLDLIKPALSRVGAELDFWKVAIKPGKPFVFGRAGSKLLFGLPGNPVSALVTFLLLGRPAIRRWQGAAQAGLPRAWCVLSEQVTNSGPRRHFVRVRIGEDGAVSSSGAQASHMLSSFAAANGLLDVPPDTTFAAGTRVPVLVWET